MPKNDVRRVVKACQVCQSIDPAPVKWARGDLNVDEIWHRVGMDVTHVNGCHYLTLIDCGPTQFAVWRRMQRQDTNSVIQQLELLFFERGAPWSCSRTTILPSTVARLHDLGSDGQ